MSPLPTIEALREMVADLKDTRAILSVPYTYELAGEAWTIACDGHGLLALKGERGGEVWVKGSTPEFSGMILPHPTEGWTPIDAAKLVAWGAAAAPDPATCKECGGTGQRLINNCEECEGEGIIVVTCPECDDEHEHDCPECDGKSETPAECGRCNDPKFLPGLFGVAQVDRAKIWRWLSWLPPEMPVEAVIAHPEHAIRFRGPDWFALVMPMRRNEGHPRELDTFGGWLVTVGSVSPLPEET